MPLSPLNVVPEVEGLDDDIVIPASPVSTRVYDRGVYRPAEHSLPASFGQLNFLSLPSNPNEKSFHLTGPSGEEYDITIKKCTDRHHDTAPHRSRSRSSRVLEQKVALDPFDLLKEGETYKVSTFTGTCPNMKGAAMLTTDGQIPQFEHNNSCEIKVSKFNEKGKHIHFKAESTGGNCHFGAVAGPYELEMILKKDRDGKLVCTTIKGISGKLILPLGVAKILDVTTGATKTVCQVGSWLKSFVVAPAQSRESAPSLSWDDVASYNTGEIEQDLDVTLECNPDGTLQFKATIDPHKLCLSGAAAAMLGAVNMVGLACSAVFDATIQVKPVNVLSDDNAFELGSPSVRRR